MTKNNINSYCPLWNYQATGVNALFAKKLWDDEFPNEHDFHKISAGIKLNIISSIASVIEGSLKNYLISKIRFLLNRREQIPQMLIDTGEEEEIISFGKSKEELKEELVEIEDILHKLSTKYLMRYKTKKLKFSILGRKYKIEYQVSTNTNKPNDEYFHKYFEVIKNETWNELVYHYSLINNEKLKVATRKVDKKLMVDIEKIFQFRNFIVHSNNIEIKQDEHNLTYDGAVKKLIKYIEENRFSDTTKSAFFIEQLVPEKLILHFKECCDKFLECDFFGELFETINLRNHIWKG